MTHDQNDTMVCINQILSDLEGVKSSMLMKNKIPDVLFFARTGEETPRVAVTGNVDVLIFAIASLEKHLSEQSGMPIDVVQMSVNSAIETIKRFKK